MKSSTDRSGQPIGLFAFGSHRPAAPRPGGTRSNVACDAPRRRQWAVHPRRRRRGRSPARPAYRDSPGRGASPRALPRRAPVSWSVRRSTHPHLTHPAVCRAVRPAIADALRAFEDQAVDAVLANHELSPSDRDEVLSYARADAAGGDVGLDGRGPQDRPARSRTTHQQAVVDWLSADPHQPAAPGPKYAASEYARFAGKDPIRAQLTCSSRRRRAGQIKDFLSGTAEPFDTTGTADATAGYCGYQPPAPYESEYDGSHRSRPASPRARAAFGCAPPTPTYDQFVKWGHG